MMVSDWYRWRRCQRHSGVARQSIIGLAGLILLIAACEKQAGDQNPQRDANADSVQQVPRGTKEQQPESASTDYRSLRPLFWSQLYGGGGNTLYCNKRFEQRGKGFNIEHVMPMSWVVNALGCASRKQCRSTNKRFNEIESDLHNLFPSLTALNNARSSYAFGVIEGEPRSFGDCDFEVNHQRKIVEPTPAVRGEIARAVLYMEQTYGVEIFEKQRRLLMQWDSRHPATAQERSRNDRIEALQGRRNTFIDGSQSVL